MDSYDFDLFTIGAGSGGVAASRRAASYGARVAIAENWRVGGTCVLRGCVPKKLLVYGTHFAQEMADARGYGWDVEGTLDWGKLVAAKNLETKRLEGIYRTMLDNAKVETILGTAKIVDPHTVEIGTRRVTAKYILIAAGGRPERPAIPGIAHTITSNEALDLETLPRRVAIVGGGYIAVEFAGIFLAAGAEVTLVLRGPKILRGFDEDVRDHLTSELVRQGVEIRANSKIAHIDKIGWILRASLEDGTAIDAEQIMYATGRVPNADALGLDAVGVVRDKAGAVAVDEWQQTSVPGIYAVGRHQPREPDAGRDRRGAGPRRDAVQRQSDVDGPWRRSLGRVQPAAGGFGRVEPGRRRTPAGHRRRGRLSRGFPADEIHAGRAPGKDADEAGRRSGDGPRARRAYGGTRRARNRPGPGDRAQSRTHQKRFRPHGRDPSDGRRRIRADAREGQALVVGR